MMNRYPADDSSDEEIILQDAQNSSHLSAKKRNPVVTQKKLTLDLDFSIEKIYSSSDESDDEKNNDTELSSFNLLIAAILVADNYLIILDSEPYAAHKREILKGLRLLSNEKDDVINIAAVIFACEHASIVASAISTFLKNNIDLQKITEYENATVRNAYLALINTGADAELIVSAIIKHNNNRELSNHFIDTNQTYSIMNNIVKLKKAGITITDIICNSFTQLAKSVYNTHTGMEMQFDDIYQLILFLSQSNAFTERAQHMLCSHDQYINAGDIVKLLQILKEKTPLPESKLEESILDIVIKQGNSAWTTSRVVEGLRDEDGINLTSDSIMTLLTFQLEKEDFLDGLLLLKTHNMLPNSMLVTAQPQCEMKPFAMLTEPFVIMLIKHPRVLSICNLLISCHGEGELYHHIEKYILLEHSEKMDSLITLNALNLAISSKRIEEMSLAILSNTDTSALIGQYRQEDIDKCLEEQELNNPQEEVHLIPSPPISPARLNSPPALFYHPPSPVEAKPTGAVELYTAVNSLPEVVLLEKPIATFSH